MCRGSRSFQIRDPLLRSRSFFISLSLSHSVARVVFLFRSRILLPPAASYIPYRSKTPLSLSLCAFAFDKASILPFHQSNMAISGVHVNVLAYPKPIVIRGLAAAPTRARVLLPVKRVLHLFTIISITRLETLQSRPLRSLFLVSLDGATRRLLRQQQR